jgi:hypothetical protein
MVLQGITDPVQRASVILDYVPVPGTTTGEVQSTYDFVMGLTPVEPTYPGGGSHGSAITSPQIARAPRI